MSGSCSAIRVSVACSLRVPPAAIYVFRMAAPAASTDEGVSDERLPLAVGHCQAVLTQLAAAAATLLGLLSTWLVGRHRCTGWLASIACCATWVAVNTRLHLWAGIASALIAAGISARNWLAWRHHAAR